MSWQSKGAPALYSLKALPRQFVVSDNYRYAVGAVPEREPVILNLLIEWTRYWGIRLGFYWVMRRNRGGTWKAFVLRRPVDAFADSADDASAQWETLALQHCGSFTQALQAAKEQALTHVVDVKDCTQYTPKRPTVYWGKYWAIAVGAGISWSFFATIFSLVTVFPKALLIGVAFLFAALSVTLTYVLGIVRFRRYAPVIPTTMGGKSERNLRGR